MIEIPPELRKVIDVQQERDKKLIDFSNRMIVYCGLSSRPPRADKLNHKEKTNAKLVIRNN